MNITIITPQATPVLNCGLFFDEKQNKFVDKYKYTIDNKTACYMVWTEQNSRYGATVANARLENFAKTYNIPAKMW